MNRNMHLDGDMQSLDIWDFFVLLQYNIWFDIRSSDVLKGLTL
jgi:hypothetical protein